MRESDDHVPTADRVLRQLRRVAWTGHVLADSLAELSRSELEAIDAAVSSDPRGRALLRLLRQLKTGEITAAEADRRMAEIDRDFPNER